MHLIYFEHTLRNIILLSHLETYSIVLHIHTSHTSTIKLSYNQARYFHTAFKWNGKIEDVYYFTQNSYLYSRSKPIVKLYSIL